MVAAVSVVEEVGVITSTRTREVPVVLRLTVSAEVASGAVVVVPPSSSSSTFN